MFTKNDKGEIVLEHAQVNASRLTKIALQRDDTGRTPDATVHVMFSNQLTSLCGDEFTLEDLGAIVAGGVNKQGQITCKGCYNELNEMYDKFSRPIKVVELLDHGYQGYLRIWCSIFGMTEVGVFILEHDKIKAILKCYTYEQFKWAWGVMNYLGNDGRKTKTFDHVYGKGITSNEEDYLEFTLCKLSLFYDSLAEYEKVLKDD